MEQRLGGHWSDSRQIATLPRRRTAELCDQVLGRCVSVVGTPITGSRATGDMFPRFDAAGVP